MNNLVSIIIPCYNAEKWVGEAIDSALSQTYTPIEVIVVDDGSTDKSLEIIKSYGDRIKWETGINRGQSAARNQGFKLSSGKYIQWLDADDYILPEKIKNQVAYLEESRFDIVYGDWCYQDELKNKKICLYNVHITGHKDDILESLLSGFALTIMNCLTKRDIIEKLNGFDERLRTCEDIYLWIKAAILGAKFGYQPGCYSIYRISHGVTISSNKLKEAEGWERVLEKVLKELELAEKLNIKYKKALAQYYFDLSKTYLAFNTTKAWHYIKIVKQLDPQFKPKGKSLYKIVFKVFGFRLTAYLFILKLAITNR